MVKVTLVSILSFVLVKAQTGILNGRNDAVINLVSIAGFGSETHRVVSEDGYFLRLHRIQPKVQKEKKGPVLMIHGLFGTSGDWVVMGRDNSLAYSLSNDGYDVWLGNVRGSKFSMKHQSFDPLARNFWQFSFHEIGYYDLPAMINYILDVTGKPGLFFVGHNQGTTALLVLLSTRPDYNQKIFHAQMMAPIAFMDYPHPLLAFQAEERLKRSQQLGTYNFYSLIDYSNMIINTYCGDRTFQTLNFCTDLWFLMFGRNRNQTEINPLMLLNIPNLISPTASIRQWNHYIQLGRSGKFQMYDARGDYLSTTFTAPREYNLLNVKVPMYIYHAAEDLVVSRPDVERLKQILSAQVRDYRVIPNWNHMDFLLSRNAKIVLYDSILSAMNNDGFDIMGFIRNIFG